MSVTGGHRPIGASNYQLQILQIWLLAGVRAFVNLGRNCMGPLIVAMTPEFGYTSAHKGQILGAFSAGYMLSQIPGGILADRFGAKHILLTSLIASGLSLLMLSAAADVGLTCLWWLLAATGFMCGPVFPAMQAMSAKWSYGGLGSYASAVGGAGTTAGSLMALGLTSPLCVRIGWRMTCAILGSAVLSFSLLWLLKARSSPDAGATVIKKGSPFKALNPDGTVLGLVTSVAGILLAPSVLVIFLVHSSQVAVRMFFSSWMPTYYDEVLLLSSEATAMYLVMPEIMGMASSLLGGNIARALERRGLPALACRRAFLAVGSVGMGLGLLSITRMSSAFSATFVLCLTQVFSNLNAVGFNANYLDVAKNTSGLVAGVGNSLASFASYVGPLITSSVLAGEAENRQRGWSLVCMIFATANFAALAAYIPLASVTPVDDPSYKEKCYIEVDERKHE